MQTVAEPAAQVPVAQDEDALTKVKGRVVSGTITFSELVESLSPIAEPEINPPAKPPVRTALSESQQKALVRLPEVYGSVIPIERRRLTPHEVTLLLEERAVIDELAKLAEGRKEAIRATASIDMDIKAAEEGISAGKLYDKRGHLILGGVSVSEDGQRAFVRRVKNKAPVMDASILETMEKAGTLPRKVWLAVTREQRVFDSNLFMAYLGKHPEDLETFRQAIVSGGQYTEVGVGKP